MDLTRAGSSAHSFVNSTMKPSVRVFPSGTRTCWPSRASMPSGTA